MSYELFERYMNIVRADYDWMEKVCDLFDTCVLYDKIRSPDTILEMLSDALHDTSDWIDYFVFELDWGKDYEAGMVVDANNQNIPLATLHDLYNLLTQKEGGAE